VVSGWAGETKPPAALSGRCKDGHLSAPPIGSQQRTPQSRAEPFSTGEKFPRVRWAASRLSLQGEMRMPSFGSVPRGRAAVEGGRATASLRLREALEWREGSFHFDPFRKNFK
jgi:hypothetical protein